MSANIESRINHAAAHGYGNAQSTALYNHARPTYDPDAVKTLLSHALSRRPDPPHTVIDMAAGTGIFTRVLQPLLPQHTELKAVEPVAAMRDQFTRATPNVLAVAGTADNTTLNDASADAIFCAQSFHWFSTESALKEFHRVLKSGGGLCLIWNNRDRSVGFVDRLDDIIDRLYPPSVPRQQTGQFERIFTTVGGDLFELPLQEAHLPGVIQAGDEQLIVDRYMSISVIQERSAEDRQQIREELQEVLRNHPDTKGKTHFEIPHTTDMYWTYKKV